MVERNVSNAAMRGIVVLPGSGATGVAEERSHQPGAVGLPNPEVSAGACDVWRPAPNARAAGRREPPCSASTPPPTQLPAQPKPRSVLHETAQSCALAPSLPRSTAEIHHPHPHHFLTPTISQHPNELGLDCVRTRAWQEPELGDFLARPAVARPES
jgi:hypothetical protein